MRPLAYTMSGAVVVLALAIGPDAWAQSRPSGGGGGGGDGSRTPSSGASSGGGHAVDRGSSGGGSGGGGSAVSSGGGYSSAPVPSGGSSSGAVSRPGGGGARMGGGGARMDGARSPRNLGSGAQRQDAVPRGSRPNSGSPSTGRAVVRQGRPPAVGDGGNSFYYPSYYGGSYYGYGGYPYFGSLGYGYPYWGLNYGWRMGGLFYNPFLWGYGYGYPSLAWDPMWDYYGGGGYGGYYGGGYGAPLEGRAPWVRGSLKLKVQPKQAEVYVDGYFAGQVDSFDGAFQDLDLEVGTHKVEVRADGYETLTFDVRIMPRETITYKGEMNKVK